MKINVLIFLFICSIAVSGQKRVCFSVDDLPVVSYGINDSAYQAEIMGKLSGAFNRNNIPAIGFVNEKKLFRDGKRIPAQIDLLHKWIDSGLELGNHTFSHPDYNKVSFKAFTEDLIKGEAVTRELLTEKVKTLKYFRHPFLHRGNTKVKADSLSNFLAERGYTVAPVTIDNDDYIFAVAYKRTLDKNDTQLAGRIGHDYVNYMESKVKYYEKQSNALFGRDIMQIQLIHASKLNADYVDSLAAMYRRNDYSFVSMDEALKDEAYKTEITAYGNWGISWIDLWALSQGKKDDFFAGEPETPEYVKKLAE
jgi:peptidoglycan/xylan/chitin deacetylase (PgdA/CDA1 family)